MFVCILLECTAIQLGQLPNASRKWTTLVMVHTPLLADSNRFFSVDVETNRMANPSLAVYCTLCPLGGVFESTADVGRIDALLERACKCYFQ